MKTILTIITALLISTSLFAGNNNEKHNSTKTRTEVYVLKTKKHKIVTEEITIKNNVVISQQVKVYKRGKLVKTKTADGKRIKANQAVRQRLSMRLPFSDRIKTTQKYRA